MPYGEGKDVIWARMPLLRCGVRDARMTGCVDAEEEKNIWFQCVVWSVLVDKKKMGSPLLPD